PVDAELQVVVQRHLRDRHLDHDLPRRDVELLQRLLDDRVLGGCGDDEERVLVLVGDDLDIAHDPGTAPLPGERPDRVATAARDNVRTPLAGVASASTANTAAAATTTATAEVRGLRHRLVGRDCRLRLE